MHSHMSACTHPCMHVRLMTRLDSREYIRRLEALVLSQPQCKLWSSPHVLPGLTRFEDQPCALITHSDALQCLKGKALAFVGDSQTRTNGGL